MDKVKMGKAEKIRATVMLILLIKESITTPDLISELNEWKDFIDAKIDYPTISPIITDLEEEGIIEREKVEKKGRGPDPQMIFLRLPYDAFYLIVDEIINKDYYPFIKDLLKKSFIDSRLAKTFINFDLIEVIEHDLQDFIKSEFELIDLNFTDEEANLILNFIKLSPLALYYIISDYKDYLMKIFETYKIFSDPSLNLDDIIVEAVKKEIFLNLQLKASEDIARNTIANMPISYNTNMIFFKSEELITPTPETSYSIEGNKLEIIQSNLMKKKRIGDDEQ